MAISDPYQTLGVAKTASQDEIKSAYRKLAKKFHPDLNPGNKEAETRFKEATEAYDLIGEAEKRAKFDRGESDAEAMGAGGFGGPGGPGPYYYQTQEGEGGRYARGFGGGFSADDIDEDLLRSIFGAGGRSAGFGGRPSRGADQRYRMEVEFEDAARGGEREITLPNGKRLRVRIPAGIDSGKTLRFAGMGEPGAEGRPAGDALVEILVRPSTRFQRDGLDLTTRLDVPFPVALAGGEVLVPTLEGNIMLKVPPRSKAGSRLRAKGKGIHDPKSGEAGNLYVELGLSMPDDVSPELEQAARAWVDRHQPRKTDEGANP